MYNIAEATKKQYSPALDKKRKKSKNSFVFSALGFFILGLLIIPNSLVHQLFLVFFLLLFTFVSIRSLRSAAIIAIAFIPLAGLLKWSGSETLISLLFQSFIFIIAFFSVVIHAVVRTNFKIGRIPLRPFLLFIPFFSIITVHILVSALEKPILGFAYLREYIIPFTMFLICFYALKKKAISEVEIVSILVAITALVSIINLAHYFFGLPSEYPKYVFSDEAKTTPYMRGAFGTFLPRSQHLLGLGSQGGGAVFYAIVGTLALLLSSRQRGISRAVTIFGASSIFAAGAIVLSGSYVITLLFLILFFSLNNSEKYFNIYRILLIFMAVPVMIYILLSNALVIGSHTQLLSYGQIFLSYGFQLVSKSISQAFYFGHGLDLFGGYGTMTTALNLATLDSWVFSVIPQIGIVGFFSMILGWVFGFLKRG